MMIKKCWMKVLALTICGSMFFSCAAMAEPVAENNGDTGVVVEQQAVTVDVEEEIPVVEEETVEAPVQEEEITVDEAEVAVETEIPDEEVEPETDPEEMTPGLHVIKDETGVITSIYFVEEVEGTLQKAVNKFEKVHDAEGTSLYYFGEDGEAYRNGYAEIMVDGQKAYYYFQKDGTAFNKGYKSFMKDGTKVYYFFQTSGQAYTDGYLSFEKDGKRHYFYFQENGQAYTGGYKQVTIDGEKFYYYFQSNGQAYKKGYKSFIKDGKKVYYYFQSNGQAYTKGYKSFTKDGKKYYFYFQSNGEAYTGGYKAFKADGKQFYFYFKSNGQAYTNGYKSVTIDGKKYYYYFKSNGQAYTGGLKSFTKDGKKYTGYFQSNGKGYTGGWKSVNGSWYYFKSNAVAATGTVTIGNTCHHFNADGKATAGWYDNHGQKAYFDGEKAAQVVRSTACYDAWNKIKNMSSPTSYFICVDTNRTKVCVFRGRAGSWKPIYVWDCSCGAPGSPTRKGIYSVGARGYSFGHDGFVCYYWTQWSGNYLFHTIKYVAGTWKELDPRMNMHISGGCVRMQKDNAYWIYKNIPSGTKVWTY